MALIIKTSFLANASKDKVWELITDIEKSAPCFPGAVLGEKISDGFYQGGFNVKLGPMTFNFSGKFGFTHLDHPQ
jgi:carbon monoxide dehydrogenase subunit G